MTKNLILTALGFISYFFIDELVYLLVFGYKKALNRFLDRMIEYSNITPMHYLHYLFFCVIGLIIVVMLVVYLLTEQM